jgi:UPF0716 protein FxsA
MTYPGGAQPGGGQPGSGRIQPGAPGSNNSGSNNTGSNSGGPNSSGPSTSGRYATGPRASGPRISERPRPGFLRRLRWVPLAVLALGVVEFFVLIGVAKLIGSTVVAVLIAVLLSFLGLALVRREGLRAWRRLRTARRAGGPAGDEVLYGVTGLIAALLLLIPGYLTGIAGLIILIPPVRRFLRDRMRKATERRVPPNVAGDMFGPHRVKSATTKPSPEKETAPSDVIEGEIVD